MDLLKKKILEEGQVYAGNILKVDCFLNHQIDCGFLAEVGKEFHRLYQNEGVNKILTIEASGIAIGAMVAQEFGCPLVFAKKNKTKNIAGDVYTAPVESFTHGTTYNIMVSKKFLNPGDKVLIVDDFLAIGNALKGLISLVKESGAELVGCGTVIEKGYQHGGDQLRAEGIRVESLAIIESMDADKGEVVFRD
ncbi:xanthine phosphoribosyltransferase [Eubacterium sp.]